MLLDVWISADGTEILNKVDFYISNKEYEAGKWYSSEEIGLWLKCRGKKWRLDNFDNAHSKLFKLVK